VKLKFKDQAYQARAVEAVVDCFKGQPNTAGINYRIDPGDAGDVDLFGASGFKNADIAITEQQILENIQAVQRDQNLPISVN
jgi:type III restriction enzyme